MKSRTVEICESVAQIIVTEVRRGVVKSRCPEHLVERVESRVMTRAVVSVSNLKEGVSFKHIRTVARRAVNGFDIESLIERLDERSRPTPSPSPKPSYRNHAHGNGVDRHRLEAMRGGVIIA